MQMKSLISNAALATALGLAGPAFAQATTNGTTAQITINGTEVPEDEMGIVRQQCLDLQALETGEPVGLSTDDDANDEGGSEASDETGANLPANSGTVGGTEQAETTFDLNSLTLEQCEESGIFDMEDGTDAGGAMGAGANADANASTTGGTAAGGNAAANSTVDGAVESEADEEILEDTGISDSPEDTDPQGGTGNQTTN